MMGSDQPPQEYREPPREQQPQSGYSTVGGQFMPEMGRGTSGYYSESHYKFLTSLIESKSAVSFFQQIIDTDFSHQCVKGYHKLLTSGFDQNAILASNKDIKMRINDFKIAMNLFVLECHESDVQNRAFLTFNENILQTFTDFISRSQNAEERKRLLRSEYGVTQEEPKKQEPTGFFNRGNRGQQR